MKKLSIIICFIGILGFFGCEEDVDSLEFDVIVDSITKARLSSETSNGLVDVQIVKFRFTGNPENIVFFSGEKGKDYQNRNNYYRDDLITKVKVSTQYSEGELQNTLRVLFSTDFVPEYVYTTGNITTSRYTQEGVEKASWTDVTNQFTLPGNSMTGGVNPSGDVDITDFISPEKPFFLAFRFDANRTTGLKAGRWDFSAFEMANYAGSTKTVFDNVLTTSWKGVNLLPDSTLWYYTTASPTTANTIFAQGNYSQAAQTQTMLISRPFYPTLVASDKGIVVKTVQQLPKEYTYVYVKPSNTDTYKATFIATNSFKNAKEQVIKEIDLNFE